VLRLRDSARVTSRDITVNAPDEVCSVHKDVVTNSMHCFSYSRVYIGSSGFIHENVLLIAFTMSVQIGPGSHFLDHST
jgi:hypothetical protein